MRSTVFVQPHEITPGESIDSSDWNGVAEALASRMELFGGLPEAVWIWFYGALRSLDLDSDEQGVGLLDAMLLEPGLGDWPVNANPASPLAGYLLGNEYAWPFALEDEATRMAPLVAATPADDIPTIWARGHSQRGLMDPDTGDANAPALEAAMVHEQIWFSPRGRQGLSYGGFAPTFPVAAGGQCNNGDPKPVRLEIRFEWIGAGSEADVVYYTCPFDEGGALAWVNLNDRWKILVVDSGEPEGYRWVDHLKSEWLLTPPDQPGLIAHQQGGHLPRALWAFTEEFAGSTEQRAQRTPTSWRMGYSFPFNTVLASRPLYLAPARAVASGDPVVLNRVETVFRWSGDDETLAAQTAGVVVVTSQNSHAIHAACHWVGVKVEATGLSNATTVEALVGGQVVKSFAMNPDPNGDYADILMFPQGVSGSVSMRLMTPATMTAGGGEITVELLELVQMNHQARDLGAVLLRLASENGGYAGYAGRPDLTADMLGPLADHGPEV